MLTNEQASNEQSSNLKGTDLDFEHSTKKTEEEGWRT